MPSLDLKPINLASLKNEVLCHPNVRAYILLTPVKANST